MFPNPVLIQANMVTPALLKHTGYRRKIKKSIKSLRSTCQRQTDRALTLDCQNFKGWRLKLNFDMLKGLSRFIEGFQEIFKTKSKSFES